MFNFKTTLELVLFIIGVCFTALSIAGIFLSIKNRGGRAFKLIALLVIPVIALTSLLSLLFVNLKVFGELLGLQIVLAFAIAAVVELIVFAIARFASRNA